VASPTRVLLAVESGLDANDLVTLLSGDPSIRLVNVVDGFDQAWRLLQDEPIDLVVLGCAGYSDRALVFLESAVRQNGDRPVVVLAQSAPSGFVRRVLEMGGEDILLLPQTAGDVVFALQKAVARRQGAHAGGSKTEKGRLIAVLGPKGGTGKTLTSSNLCVALAQKGHSTAIVDLDLQFGDIALCMGLPPEHTIHDLSVTSGSIDLEKLDAFLARHPSGARALIAPNRPDQASTVTSQLVQEVYATLRSEFDFTVVDTPPGFTPEVITTIDASTDVVMVGMLDSLSLKNTKLGLETLELMGYDQDRITLVLNRAQSRVGISHSDVVAVLGRKPDVLVPSDREIPRAVNEGIPIMMAQPNSEASLAFGQLADLFIGTTLTTANGAGPETAAQHQSRRLFARRSGRSK
jgi:pilus assembly protein CpaE